MLIRIFSSVICLSLILQSFPVYAMDITILKEENAKDELIEHKLVRCLTVKKATSGQVRLAFDKSLEREGADFHLILDKTPVGQVFYKKGQLNFRGYAGHSFTLESPDTYVHPAFCAQTEGDLCLAGGHFSKESAFISENLTTSGKYTGLGTLRFQSRQGLSFQGDYTISQLALQAKTLKLNAAGSADVIQVHAESIDEAATNKFFAEKQMVFSGYSQGFTHRGTLKSKNKVIFKGGAYTGCSGSQTLAGCLLYNQSNSINESGSLIAKLGHFQSPKIAFKRALTFSGDYFLAEGTGDLTTDPQSSIYVEYGAKLATTGKLNHQGAIKQVDIIFPCLELFGLGTFSIPSGTPHQQYNVYLQKVGEIQNLQTTHLPTINFHGIALEGAQELVIKETGLLCTNTDNIELKSKKLISKGTIQSGFFEGLKTIVKAKSILLEGVITGDLEINGVMHPKSTLEQILPIVLPKAKQRPTVRIAPKLAKKQTPTDKTTAKVTPKPAPKLAQKVPMRPTPMPKTTGKAVLRPTVRIASKLAKKQTPTSKVTAKTTRRPAPKLAKVPMKSRHRSKTTVKAALKPAVKVAQKAPMKPRHRPKTTVKVAPRPVVTKGKIRARAS